MGNGLRIIQAINVGLCLLGVLVFGALLAYVQTSAQDFERRSQGFIADQIEVEINEKLTPAGTEKLKEAAGKLSERLQKELERKEAQIKAGVPKFIASIIAALCRLDCQDRAALEARITKSYEEDLAHLNLGLGTLRGMVESRYSATLAELRRDITIFLSCNLAAVTLALGVAMFRGPAARHLLPIPILLTLSTALASYWYVFGQNWVLAIVYSDYVGWSYLIFLGIVGLFLADIAFNRARVMSQVLSSLPSAIIPVPILPC